MTDESNVKVADPLIGKTIDDRYRVEVLLGAGGMGKVYGARHLGLERAVALKILKPEFAADHDRVERFKIEARATSRIKHPNTVTVHDFGQYEGLLYIVMELISGLPLHLAARDDMPMAAERASAVISRVADGVGAAHAAGVVHRDLKPDNVMVLREPAEDGADRIKVVDFGLAVLVDEKDRERLTREGRAVGTPAYMSPEQARGRLVDQATDIYSLGVMLYELLSGVVPFEGTPQEVLLQHLLADPVPPSERVPEVGIHPAFDAVVLWAMGKDADSRPPSIEVFREELAVAAAIARGAAPASSRRKAGLVGADRRERALAFGLPQREGTTQTESPAARAQEAAKASAAAATLVVAVCESGGADFTRSLTACLRAAAIGVRPQRDLADAPNDKAEVFIVDGRADAAATVQQLAEHIEPGGLLHGLPVIFVGPDETVELMSRVIELGVDSYVPASKLTSRLPKVVRRALKRFRRAKTAP